MMNINDFVIQSDDSWHTLAAPVSKNDFVSISETSEDSNYINKVKDKKSKSVNFIFSPILTFQLIVCLFVLTLAFVAKTFFFEQYEAVKSEYDGEITSSMFFDGKIKDNEFDSIFSVTIDEG